MKYWDGTGVTTAMLKEEVVRLATEQPEFIYAAGSNSYGDPMCRYTELDNTPGCIVGQAIYNLTGLLVDQEEMGAVVHTAGWQKALELDRYRRGKTSEELRFVREIQSWQDCGMSWGESLHRAQTAFPNQ